MRIVENVIGKPCRFGTEEQDVAWLVVDGGVEPRRVCGVGEDSFRCQCFPSSRQAFVHGDRGEVVVVEAGSFELGLGHVEAEWTHEVQFATGSGDEAYGVAGVLRDPGFEEHESKHPTHSAITGPGKMGQVEEQTVGEDYSDARLDQQEWTDRSFVSCNFLDADMSGVKTKAVVFTECDFTGTDFTESIHVDTAFRSCTFTRTNLQHSTFRHASFIGSTFVDCRMRPATFDEVDFTLAGLGGADLQGVDLTGCRMVEANLVGADLRKATLAGVDFTGARANGVKLDRADLRGAQIDADTWVTATLAAARIEMTQAVAYAQARGLWVEG